MRKKKKIEREEGSFVLKSNGMCLPVLSCSSFGEVECERSRIIETISLVYSHTQAS